MATKWTSEQLAYVTNNYRTLGPKACVLATGKTLGAVRVRAIILGVAKKNNLADYTQENLNAVVAKCFTLSEVLLILNIKNAGGNFKTLRDKIAEYAISTNHFDPATARVQTNILLRRTPYDETFCQKSKASRGSVKAWFKVLGRVFVCELDGCGQGEVWRGRKMSLVLDHINGVRDDNRMENLRLVCPNCNATLDTHGGKNTIKAKLNRTIKNGK